MEILDYARTQKEVEEENYILVKKDSQSVRVNLKDIIYIEAQKHYVNLFLISGECVTVKTGFSELLQSVQEKSKEFITTHRSYAVNIEKLSGLEERSVFYRIAVSFLSAGVSIRK